MCHMLAMGSEPAVGNVAVQRSAPSVRDDSSSGEGSRAPVDTPTAAGEQYAQYAHMRKLRSDRHAGIECMVESENHVQQRSDQP